MFDIKLFGDISLRIYLEDGRIKRAEFIESVNNTAPLYLMEKFSLYIKGEGDPSVNMEELDLSGYDEKVLRVYRVLNEVCTFGNVITYSKLAEITCTHPRFVGYCMRINRFPLIIPCHRVVGKIDLGGFSFGVDLKRKLLYFESAIF